MLRKTFGPKKEEVTRKWKKLHNAELNDLYSSPSICSDDQIEKNEVGEACSAFGGKERRIQDFDGET